VAAYGRGSRKVGGMVSNDEETGPVLVGQHLESRVQEMYARLRSRGPLPSSERHVDWTTGEGGERLQWLLRISGVPEQYRGAELPRVAQAVRSDVSAYVADVRSRRDAGQGLTILGNPGTGKSCVAAVVVQEYLKAGMKVRWSYVPDLCDLMLDSWKRKDVRAAHSEPDLVVLDDFLARPLSEFEVGLLDQIQERRYQRRKPTIVASNKTPEELRADPRLSRMVDRWRHRNLTLVLAGKSMRVYGR
jgi:hypothetical protein